MSKSFFYDSPILPSGFCFPKNYLQLSEEHDILDFEPWKFLFLDMPKSLNYYGAMLQKYPDKPLVPFAIIDDQSGFYNDGYVVLACFDGDDKSGDPKVYFHDYSNPKRVNWADRYSLVNFTEWLRVAGEESARYKAERAEDKSK
jgi:hypothetical protein